MPVDALERAVAVAAEDALVEQGLRRLQSAVPGADRLARRAVLRAGFRQEGVQREAFLAADGSVDDLYLFARLAGTRCTGRTGSPA